MRRGHRTAGPETARIETTRARVRDRLSSGASFFLLDGALALDAIAGERERFESLLRDCFTAALAIAEAPLVQLLQGGHHFFQQPPIAIAQLEQELAVVGRRGLISEILDRVVVGTLAVEDVLANFVDELTILLFQLRSEVSQAFLLHRCLLRHCISRPRLIAQATTAPIPLQSLEREGIIPRRKEA